MAPATGPPKHLPYHRLLEQLREPGCAVCILGAREAARALDAFCWEHVNDPGVRERLRASLGFCPQHAHQLDAHPDRLAIAILYGDLVRHAAQELGRRATARRSTSPHRPCPVCQVVEEQERECIEVLAAFIDDPEMDAARRNSTGLCLGHTLDLCRRLKGPALRRVVAEEQARLQGLAAELAEFVRKRDYRFRDEPWGPEKAAPSRAVAKLAGEKSAIDPRATGGESRVPVARGEAAEEIGGAGGEDR